jgi:hypothetical protein
MQVRIEKPNTLKKAIKIATDLEIQKATQHTDNGRRENIWMGPVYSY